MFINFADKAVLGLAAQPLMAELKLSPEQFGLIGSAFFLLFPLSAVLVGFVTNRVAARHSPLAGAGAPRPSRSFRAAGQRLIAKMRRRPPCVPASAPVSWRQARSNGHREQRPGDSTGSSAQGR